LIPLFYKTLNILRIESKSMKNIINVSKNVIGQESVNSVNAREVYEYLGVKTECPLWFKRR